MADEGFDDRFRHGIDLINKKEFFEAHDVLEELWNETRGELRLFLQGMIQAAVACHHLSNGNTSGAVSQYTKSLDKLRQYPDVYLGIDLKSFRHGLEQCYEGVCLMLAKNVRYEVDTAYFPAVEFVSS